MKKKTTKNVGKKYKATLGAPFKKSKVQKYGECLNKLSEKHNGRLKPQYVVDEARSSSSPLHDYFDWDDSVAAEKYRIYQARNLINHITVEISYDNEKQDVKGWFSVNSTPNDERLNKVYVTVDRVINEPELRNQILISAIQEADYWKEKYQQYTEFSSICKAIALVKSKIVKKKKQKPKRRH